MVLCMWHELMRVCMHFFFPALHTCMIIFHWLLLSWINGNVYQLIHVWLSFIGIFSGLWFKGKVCELHILIRMVFWSHNCFLLWLSVVFLTKSYGLFRYTTDGGSRETLEKGTIRGDAVFSGSVCDQLMF